MPRFHQSMQWHEWQLGSMSLISRHPPFSWNLKQFPAVLNQLRNFTLIHFNCVMQKLRVPSTFSAAVRAEQQITHLLGNAECHFQFPLFCNPGWTAACACKSLMISIKLTQEIRSCMFPKIWLVLENGSRSKLDLIQQNLTKPFHVQNSLIQTKAVSFLSFTYFSFDFDSRLKS